MTDEQLEQQRRLYEAAYEAKAKALGYDFDSAVMVRDIAGLYVVPSVQTGWWAWQTAIAGQSSICCWTYDSDSFSWDTGCGEKWTLMDGGPKENGMHFCHACGGKLEEESHG
ncbi:hypothetical protein [Metapseudomonas sp. CR1201]